MQVKGINVTDIESKIGYVFKDKSLLVQAFTRSSFCNEHTPSRNEKYQSNEVLEFFGDGVLSVAIISFLMKECTERYAHGIKTELGEGDFSNIKSKLSDKQNLSKSMKALGLQKHLRMGEGDAKLGIENEPSVMEDLFESIVGAIYIDSDMSIDAVIKAVSTMLDMSVYTDSRKPMQSAKNALQEWCADKKRRLPAPRYETLSEDGPDHKKTYMRGCYVGDRLVGRGVGKNFKIADAIAAEDALNALIGEESALLTTKPSNNTTKHPSAQEQSANAKKANQDKKAKVSDSAVKKNERTEISSAKEKTVSEDDGKADVSPMARLKAYASSQKKPGATFKDLGEAKSGSHTECRVECLFSGESTVGVGSTRSEARENAVALMIERIGIGAKKKKSADSGAKKSAPSKKASASSHKSGKTAPAKTAKGTKHSATTGKKTSAPSHEAVRSAQAAAESNAKSKQESATSPTNSATSKRTPAAKRHAKARKKPIVKI